LILALDFSHATASIALLTVDAVVDSASSVRANTHVSTANVLIRDLLSRNQFSISDLTAVSTNNGPGSYTGLRVANMIAKAICYVRKIPLIPIAGHDILENHHKNLSGPTLCLIDANKGCAYARLRGVDYASSIVRLNLNKDLESTHDDPTLTKVSSFLNSQKGPIITSSLALQNILLDREISSVFYHPISAELQVHSLKSCTHISDFTKLSLQAPLYVLSPNITKRKKPLL